MTLRRQNRIRELEALRRRAEREEFARWGDHDQWTKDREVAHGYLD